MSILNNHLRVGNFTSSSVWKLLTKPKGNAEWSEKALTYIDEKNWERRLGRSLGIEKFNRATAWGHLMELRVHELLNNIHYRATGKVTISHPTIEYWKGSPDMINESESVVGDTKGYELKALCEYVDALEYAKEHNTLEELKKSHPEELWQLIKIAIITGSKYIEAVVYVPYLSEINEIKELANLYDGADQFRYKYIYDAESNELPYLIDGNHYKNLNIFRFEVPQSDKDLLTDKVLQAGKLLDKTPLVMLATHDSEHELTLIEKAK